MKWNRKRCGTALVVGMAIVAACAYTGSDTPALAAVTCETIDGMPISGFIPGALEKQRVSAPLHIDPGMVVWVDGCKRR